MVPSCRGEQVAPSDVGLVVNLAFVFDSIYYDVSFILPVVEDVTPVVGVEEQSVPVAEPMGHLSVEVIEIVVRRDVRRSEQSVEQKCVHSSGAD